jgi:hypothetical protein
MTNAARDMAMGPAATGDMVSDVRNDVEDDVWLSAHFGDEPAGHHGNEAGRRHGHAPQVKPARGKQLFLE